MKLTPVDLIEIDKDYVPGNFLIFIISCVICVIKYLAGLLYVRDLDGEDEFTNLDISFCTSSSTGRTVILGTEHKHVTQYNKHEYIQACLHFRYNNLLTIYVDC